MLAARLFIFKVSIESHKIRLPILSRFYFHALLSYLHKMPVFSWKIVPACTMEHKDLWNCNQYFTKYCLNSTFCLDRYQSYKTSREIDKKSNFSCTNFFSIHELCFKHSKLSKFSLFTTTFQTQIAQNLFIRPVHLKNFNIEKSWDSVVVFALIFLNLAMFQNFSMSQTFSMFFKKTTKPMVKN